MSLQSAVEHRPADLVSQLLIFEDAFANRLGELFALPTALAPAGALSLACGGSRTRGLDRIGSSPEFMCGDMRHRGRLAGRIGGVPSGSTQLSGRRLGMASRRAALGHLDLAARPGPRLLDRVARPRVRGLDRLEEGQNVLCARGRPQSQEPVVGIRQRPAAADGDKAGVAFFGEDHGGTRPIAKDPPCFEQKGSFASEIRLNILHSAEIHSRAFCPILLRFKPQMRHGDSAHSVRTPHRVHCLFAP